MENEARIREIREQAEKANYHAAINIALSGVNKNRRNRNREGVDTFIRILKELVAMIETDALERMVD